LQNSGSTERNLINSKIGTEKLKNSIGSWINNRWQPLLQMSQERIKI
jgi:hypothetical protein